MEIFVEFGIILVCAALVASIMFFLKQPLIVGYIISGLLLGPFFLNILDSSSSQLDLFSKIGISILLFIVGLNLNFASIKDTGKTSLVTGLGQVVFTSFLGFFILSFLGFDNITSFYASVALTFSSTIIILKLLSDRGDLNKLYGRISIGFLLVQDLVAAFLLIIVPIIATYNINGDGNFFGIISLLVLRGVFIVSVVYFIARMIFPKLFNFLAKNQEVLFIFSIAWGLILSAIFYKMGYSIEIGALVAGISLASSKYSTEISARLRPLRDFFIVLFFILLGAHLEFTQVSSQILPLVVLSLFVLVGNPFIVFILMNLLGFKRKIGFMAGLTVAQISEFSLILMALGFNLGHVSKDAVSLITLVGIITITGSTYLIRYSEKIYLFMEPVLKFLEFRKKKQKGEKDFGEIYDAIIFGFGRVGREFAHKLNTGKEKFLIVEYNPTVIKELEKEKFNFAFGDAEDVEFLDDINLSKAKRVITTIPDFNINRLLIKYYKYRNSDGIIISVAKDLKEAESLYEDNADFVMVTYLLGAHHATGLLENYNSNKDIFKLAKKEYLNYLTEHKKNSLNYND